MAEILIEEAKMRAARIEKLADHIRRGRLNGAILEEKLRELANERTKIDSSLERARKMHASLD
jgi:hypothetical protein